MSDPYQDLADRLKRKDLETSNQFLVAENATLRESLMEALAALEDARKINYESQVAGLVAELRTAQERVEALEKALKAVQFEERQMDNLTSYTRDIVDAALRPSPQAAPKPCCEPCPTGRCSPSAPCVCEVKPQATPKPEWKKPTVERKVCDCRNHERQVCDICTGVIFIDPKDRKDNPTTKPQATTGKECEVEPEAESPRCVCYDEPGSLSCPSCEKLNDRESR